MEGGEIMKKILATSWHPGGANAIVPVIKNFISQGKAAVVTVGYQFSEDIFRNRGIGYWPLSAYGLKDASASSMIRLLEIVSPDLILTGTSMQDEANHNVIEQTITLVAKKLGIKSLAVLDAWGNYSARFSDVFSPGKCERFKFLPDKIAVMDEIAKDAMLQEGFPEDLLTITGNPHFDDLAEKARNFFESRKKEIKKKIGMGSELMILFAGNMFKKDKTIFGFWDLDNISLMNAALQLADGKSAAGAVVSFHPRATEEDKEEIRRYIEKYGNEKIRTAEDIDIQDLVLASDLILAANSMVAVEAAYMRKPCISMQPCLKGKDTLILSKMKLIPVCYTRMGCIEEVRKAIFNEGYRNMILESAAGFKTDGEATERVARVAYEMLR